MPVFSFHIVILTVCLIAIVVLQLYSRSPKHIYYKLRYVLLCVSKLKQW